MLPAFTVLELLVVIGIIGILVSIGLPALKGIGQSNVMAAVNRQVLDDISYARMRAISDRTTVYLVFVPPTNVLQAFAMPRTANELRRLTNLIPGQYTGYAVLSERTVGDQPGQNHPRYLGNWRTLPSGVLFTPFQFDPKLRNSPDPRRRALPNLAFPFPDANSSSLTQLPYIAFNAEGQLVWQRDMFVSVSRGSVFYPRNNSGQYLLQPPDVVLTPPGPQNHVSFRISWLTGRAKVESATFPSR